ncbi:unnamed protein product [Linum trigynum]|uniref:Uncharacterized protein n=1 Tax=Linum trigynum TaxID=586398 RepID=A0AAV2EBN4_9ROSI
MLEELHQKCTEVTCMDGTRRVDRMVYRYPNRYDESLWNEEFLITTQEDVDAMVQFFTTNNIKQAEMFVYIEAVKGSVGHSGDGQTYGIHGGSVLYEYHPHQEYQDSSWRQKYYDGTGGHHQSFPSYKEEAQQEDGNQQAGYQYQPEYNFYQSGVSYHKSTNTITELVNAPFMMIIRWNKRSIQVQLVTLRLKKRKPMSVQTASILLKVLMIPVQIQMQTVMRYLVTVYLSHTTITFQMKIGMLMPTWTRQRCQYVVHSLALRRANNLQRRMWFGTLFPLKQ